jgi:hypothetical protein
MWSKSVRQNRASTDMFNKCCLCRYEATHSCTRISKESIAISRTDDRTSGPSVLESKRAIRLVQRQYIHGYSRALRCPTFSAIQYMKKKKRGSERIDGTRDRKDAWDDPCETAMLGDRCRHTSLVTDADRLVDRSWLTQVLDLVIYMQIDLLIDADRCSMLIDFVIDVYKSDWWSMQIDRYIECVCADWYVSLCHVMIWVYIFVKMSKCKTNNSKTTNGTQ